MRRNGRQNTNECWVGRRRANSRTEPASDPIREPSGGEGRRFPNTSVRSRLRLTIRKAANDFVQQSKWHWPLAPPFFLAADAKHIAATHADGSLMSLRALNRLLPPDRAKPSCSTEPDSDLLIPRFQTAKL